MIGNAQIKTVLLKARVEKDHVLKSLRVDRSLTSVMWRSGGELNQREALAVEVTMWEVTMWGGHDVGVGGAWWRGFPWLSGRGTPVRGLDEET